MTPRSRWLAGIAGVVVLGLALVALDRTARDLLRTRPVVAAFARIVAAANAGDLATVRILCTDRYQKAQPIEPAPGGGVAGLPRQVHPNYRVWIDGAEVRFCPANRVGTVYRFVREGDAWKLDGVAGVLGSDGGVVPLEPAGGAEAGRPGNS